MAAFGTVLTMTLTIILSGCGQAQNASTASTTASSDAALERTKTCLPEQEAANKKVAETFVSLAATPEKSLHLIHPDYIQHSGLFVQFGKVNGAQGRRVMTELVPELQRSGLGGPPPPLPPNPTKPKDNDLYMVTVECDLVTVVGQHYRPDPVHQGEYYPTFFFDMWRIKDGKLYEHWDGLEIPDPPPEFLKMPLKDLQAARPTGSDG